MAAEIDLLVTGGTVVCMDAGRRVHAPGAVAVAAGRIADVGPEAEVLARMADRCTPATRRIDAGGSVVMPGLVDAHAHAGHSLTKTLGYGSTAAWEKVVIGLYAHGSSPDFWEADARLAALERLKGGVTCGLSILGGYIIRTDDPEYAARHCTAYAQTGLRGILAVGPCAPPFPRRFTDWRGDQPVTRDIDFDTQLATCRTVVEAWDGAADGRIGTMLFAPLYWPGRSDTGAAEAAGFVAQNLLVRDLARDLGQRLTQDNHQRGTVRAIRDSGLLGPGMLLSHCIDLDPDEVAMIADSGAAVAHNPMARVALTGRCPTTELRAAGVAVAVASDAASPDRSNDMFRHLLEAVRLQWRHSGDVSAPTPEDAFAWITIDAARALGLDHEIGSLETGKQADLIVIGMARPHLAPANMPLHRLLHYATAQDVDTVVVGGRILMQDRAVLTCDEPAVIAMAEREIALAMERAGL